MESKITDNQFNIIAQSLGVKLEDWWCEEIEKKHFKTLPVEFYRNYYIIREKEELMPEIQFLIYNNYMEQSTSYSNKLLNVTKTGIEFFRKIFKEKINTIISNSNNNTFPNWINSNDRLTFAEWFNQIPIKFKFIENDRFLQVYSDEYPMITSDPMDNIRDAKISFKYKLKQHLKI